MKTVYLAGPIADCTGSEANDWRVEMATRLMNSSNGYIRGISPLRCEPLVGERYELSYDDPRFGTANAIWAKNEHDLRACDMVLAYLPVPEEGRRHSWGTIVEVAGGYFLNKSVITVTDDPVLAAHPVISQCSSWLLDNMDDAFDVITGILGGYIPGGKFV